MPILGPQPSKPPVVARWEWRSFIPGDPAGTSRDVAAESPDIYLLAAGSPHNVKVRNGQVDIKRLEATDANGLERWRPVLKAAFPLDAAALAAIHDAWGLPASATTVPLRVLDDLLTHAAELGPAVRAVTVVKDRTAIVVASCPGERARLAIDGAPWSTLSFEHADPARVLAALGELGLDARSNENYPRALKRACGMTDHSDPPWRIDPC